MSRILVNYPGGYKAALERYEGKNALFQIECDGKMMHLRGVFHVLPDPSSGSIFVYIFHAGRIAASDPPDTAGYDIHLSQSHLDSVVPGIFQEKGDHWEVQFPFGCRHHIPSNMSHHVEP